MNPATPVQRELDATARELGWERGRYGTWKAHGYTLSVSAKGYPRRELIASKDGVRHRFRAVEDLVSFIWVGGWPAMFSRTTPLDAPRPKG